MKYNFWGLWKTWYRTRKYMKQNHMRSMKHALVDRRVEHAYARGFSTRKHYYNKDKTIWSYRGYRKHR